LDLSQCCSVCRGGSVSNAPTIVFNTSFQVRTLVNYISLQMEVKAIIIVHLLW
jgi:hypothetical protein